MNNEDLRNYCQTLIDHESRCLSKEELNLCKAVLSLLDQLRVAEEALEFYAERRHLDWLGSSDLYMKPNCEIDAWERANNFLSVEMGNKARAALEALRAGHERGNVMILNQEQIAAMAEAAKPLMKFLSGFHPHVQIVVTSSSAEFLEGIAMEKNDGFLKD